MWRWKAFLRTPGWRLVNLGRWLVDHSHRDSSSGDQKVTPSCGCILCDLKLALKQAGSSGTFYHETQHGPVRCSRQ